MRVRDRLLAALAVVAVSITGLPVVSPAGAATVESYIGFGFLDNGTRLDDGESIFQQYEASDGIVFFPAVVNFHCAEFHSSCDAARTGNAAAGAPSSEEFRWEPFTIQFTDVTRDTVGFGLRAMVNEIAPTPYVIEALDNDGNVVDSASGVVEEAWIDVALTGVPVGRTIASVQVSGGPDGNNRLLIDDLESTGDDTNPPPAGPEAPTISVTQPVDERTYDTVDFPAQIPIEFEVIAADPLSRVEVSIKDHTIGRSWSVPTRYVLCSTQDGTPTCPADRFTTSGLTLPVPDEGRFSATIRASSGFGTASNPLFATTEEQVFFNVAHVDPEPVLLGVEINQGVQGMVTITDHPSTPDAQDYESWAVLSPGKDTVIRLYWGASRSIASSPGPLVVEVLDRSNGTRTTHTLSPLPAAGGSRPPLPAIDPHDREEWPEDIEDMRRSLDATANYVLSGDQIPNPVEISLFPEWDTNRMRARFGERTRLGVNVVGLFDDANAIPPTTLEEFERDGLPAMRKLMPYSEIEALSYHAAHWSELPHSSNDHLNDVDDPTDDTPHEPGCAIATAMRLWGFGSEAERSYADMTNSWVVDAGVMDNGKSDRNLRGCAFTPFDPPRTGGTFTSDLSATLAHEAGHIHGFPHVDDDHGAEGTEEWPYIHTISPRLDGHPQVHTVYGVTVEPDASVAGGWTVDLRDPCVVGDCPSPRVHCTVLNPACTDDSVVETERHDLMSYGPYRWTSVITWNRFYRMAVDGESFDATDPGLAGPMFAAAAAVGAAGSGHADAALVTGRRTVEGEYVIDQVLTKPVPFGALDDPQPEDPDFVVEAVAADGTVLDEFGGVIGSSDAGPEGEHFFAVLPASDDVAEYRMVVDGFVEATLAPRGAAPRITNVTVTPPDGGFVTADWDVEDAGDHTTVLWVSYDGGETWLPGAYVQPGQADSVRLYVADAPSAAQISVRLITTDGFSSDRAEVAGATCRGLEPTIVGDGTGPIVGTDGDDVIMGTPGDDVILGGQGHDVICGAGGDDEVDAGVGEDVVAGGAGNDTIDGEQGADLLLGGDGDDTIRGGTGDDALHGEGGDDVLAGGRGDDLLAGGPGLDSTTGGQGNDIVAP